MESLFILIIISLIVGFSGFIFFIFSGKKKQFEDIEGPKYRMLYDEDEENENGTEKDSK